MNPIDYLTRIQADAAAALAILQCPVPLLYSALTDRQTRPTPPLPPLGGASFAFPDPVFGSWITRLTDHNTAGGLSVRTPSIGRAWNVDGSRLWLLAGSALIFDVN